MVAEKEPRRSEASSHLEFLWPAALLVHTCTAVMLRPVGAGVNSGVQTSGNC